MTYATQQDLLNRFTQQELIELTDNANIGQIDTAVLGVALADADAEINSYLVGKYSLPLTQVSPELVRMACDITRYRLWDARASEAVKTRYADAISKLRDISKGLASLGIDQLNQPVAETTASIKVSASNRVFSASLLSDFHR